MFYFIRLLGVCFDTRISETRPLNTREAHIVYSYAQEYVYAMYLSCKRFRLDIKIHQYLIYMKRLHVHGT